MLKSKEFRQVIKENKTLMYAYVYDDKIKNIIAKIDDDNNVIVKCPSFVSVKMLDNFVLKHFDRFEQFISRKKTNSLIDINQNKISLLGKPYSIIIRIINSGREKYEIIDNHIYLSLKSENNKKKMIQKMLRELGENYLILKAQKWAINFAKIYNVKPSNIKTKWYEAKWGQCNCTTNEITLAIQLYMLHEHIIDYVIVHELCHLIYPNHSPEFWQLVSKFCSNYKYIKEKLKFEC